MASEKIESKPAAQQPQESKELETTKEPKAAPMMQCELAFLDKRIDSHGHKVYSKRQSQENDGKPDW
ncbi:hypothetical protein F4779DRAFT_635670 [Xylariaceae sp. FL0662B]|nr:hypothetical protein F4779DRAFT_635670 [Xylariaceae sp. FL0662B]